ncbi:MAG: 3-phosphoserine/phosphohydroxythreonine transaminase [Betaproteobacteria bacterium]
MRVYNFSSGPAKLPEEVLRQAGEEMLSWHGKGYSIMETSHRSPEFTSIIDETGQLLRSLLGIPDDYSVLFLQGGAHLQFAMVPLNLLGPKTNADYLLSGIWSEKAAEEARRFCNVNVVADNAASDRTVVPGQGELKLDPSAAFVHYCSNETINGLEFPYVPQTGGVPLVADMSSHFLSRSLDVTKFGVIYAGAQKNFGPAGLTVVIVRNDLLGRCSPRWPTMLDYRTYAEAHSMYNTPPTYSVYIAHLVLKWLQSQGGIEGIERRNVEKAALLYDAIDRSGFYANRIDRRDRSRMNVPFSLADPRLDGAFLEEAGQRGLVQLKGHRLVGGMRASIYNAMPVDGVRALVDFMQDFERRHG